MSNDYTLLSMDKAPRNLERRPSARVARQIADVYARMAREVRYRPAAPSDGFGNITVPEDELDLGREQESYIASWWRQEDVRRYAVGCPAFPMRKVMILAIEAARACCGGQYDLARPLLELALDELRLAEA